MTTRGSTIIEQEDYTYPASGAHMDQISRKQVTRLLDTAGTETFYITYAYDGQNQLTAMSTYSGVYGSTESHTTLASQTWAFDALGNRTDLTTNIMNEYTADDNSHALAYDARGNLTQTYTFDYTYDSLDRLTSAAPTDHARSKSVYTYDFMSRRTGEALYSWNTTINSWDVTPFQVTQFLYDGWNIIAEVDADTGKMTKSYQWDPTKYRGVGGLLSITTYNENGTVDAVYIPYFNAHSDVAGLINQATGAVTATYTYQAYGQVTITGNGLINPFRWQTAYQLDATDDSGTTINDGIYTIGPRTTLGERWMQRDPSGEHGGQNAAKVIDHNDPVNRFDPDGLDSINILDDKFNAEPVNQVNPTDMANYSIDINTMIFNSVFSTSVDQLPSFSSFISILFYQYPEDTIMHALQSNSYTLNRQSISEEEFEGLGEFVEFQELAFQGMTSHAIIYVWNYVPYKNAGHAAMEYSDGLVSGYVSFWPNGSSVKPFAVPHNYMMDCDAEGGKPGRIIAIWGVDASAMDREWKAIQADMRSGKVSFDTFGNNCSTVVAKVLWHGLDHTKPNDKYYYIDDRHVSILTSAWEGPEEIPGIDCPVSLLDMLVIQSPHNNHEWWYRNITITTENYREYP